MQSLVRTIKTHFWFFACAGILALLLFKNPFSQRTLIPNFEPFPDTFYYLSPARCFVQGKGFTMCLEHFPGKSADLPPLYSLLLVPFFTIYNDPRMFYFLNLVLSFASLWLLYAILQKITKQPLIQGLVMFIYVTSYVTYWYPTLAMTENILMTIFFLAVWLLMEPLTTKKIIAAGMVATGFYGSKYAAVGATGAFGALYVLKIVNQTKDWQGRGKRIGLFALISFGLFILLGGWRLFNTLLIFVSHIFQTARPVEPVTTTDQVAAETTTWLNPQFIVQNLQFYGQTLIGKPTRILWDTRPLYPSWVAVVGLIGVAIGLVKKKYRFLTASLLLLLCGQLFAALPFYSNDGRYSLFMLPLVLIGFTITLSTLIEKFKKVKNNKMIAVLGIGLLLLIYALPKAQLLRQQIVLNLKYAEQPWWYLSTLQFNEYFSHYQGSTKPYLITLHSPFYLDYFSNDTYQPLPLSKWQDFKGGSEPIWGIPGPVPLPTIFEEKLKAGDKLFVTNYGISGSGAFNGAFEELQQQFVFKQVHSGCYELCNIYEMSLKSE